MPAIYGDADIVVDQLALGSYGVAACEAMAAGRIVLGHVSEQVRSAAQEAAGLDLPILEVTPDSIVERIRELLADRESARDTAARGPEFVRTLHDGRRSASVLADFLCNGDRAPALGYRRPPNSRTLSPRKMLTRPVDIIECCAICHHRGNERLRVRPQSAAST